MAAAPVSVSVAFRRRWSWAVLLAVPLVVLASPAAAQGPPLAAEGTDTDLQEGRSYFSPEPWEIFDQQSGDLRLVFTVLVLPGNAGRDLRIVRSYSNQRGWVLGIAGLVNEVVDRLLPGRAPRRRVRPSV